MGKSYGEIRVVGDAKRVSTVEAPIYLKGVTVVTSDKFNNIARRRWIALIDYTESIEVDLGGCSLQRQP
jgi:hypothetical protein